MVSKKLFGFEKGPAGLRFLYLKITIRKLITIKNIEKLKALKSGHSGLRRVETPLLHHREIRNFLQSFLNYQSNNKRDSLKVPCNFQIRFNFIKYRYTQLPQQDYYWTQPQWGFLFRTKKVDCFLKNWL